MKATGVVRRLDDLGRIVIPKEIRRNLKLKEGDALEIFISKDNELVFKPYFENERILDDFVEAFREMDVSNRKEIIIRLVEEMG